MESRSPYPDPSASHATAAKAVLMVRPRCFRFNSDTAQSNAFQTRVAEHPAIQQEANAQFDRVATVLSEAGVQVLVLDAPATQDLPDALFPNNWISTHADGTVVLYPMCHVSRRGERSKQHLRHLGDRYSIRQVVDLSSLENAAEFVEGTGSLVLDHRHRVAFACRSPRTTRSGVEAASRVLGYEPVVFEAVDRRAQAIYHTNVMMAVAAEFAIVCGAAVVDPHDRARILDALGQRHIVDISLEQLDAFAANVLELRGHSGPVLALSTRALAALTLDQRHTLERYATLLPMNIDTIEQVGGGGVRCMLAEIFLPETAARAGAGATVR